MTGENPAANWWTNRRFVGAMVGIWLVHLGLVFHLLPPRFLASDAPILFADYTHNLRLCLLDLELRTSGARWGYDPFQMAGYPANTRDGAGDRAGTAFVGAFGRANPVRAFKLWILIGFAAFPLLVGAALAAFGGDRTGVVAGTWVAALVWAVDPTFRLFREFGGFAFVLVVALSFLAASLLWRWFLTGARWSLAALGLAAAAAVWVHVGSLAVIAFAAAVTIAARPYDLRRWRVLAAAGVLAAAVASALVWIVPTLENLRWLSPTAPRLGALGVRELCAVVTLAPGRRFETVMIWLGVAGSVALLRRAPRLGAALFVPGLAFLLLAFVKLPEWSGLTQFQPQRLLLAAMVWLIPGTVTASRALLGRFERGARTVLLGVVVALGLAFQLLPWLQVAAGAGTRIASLADRAVMPADLATLVSWLRGRPSGGQVLLEDMDDIANRAYHGTYIGGLLPFLTGHAVLGGPEGLPFQQQVVDLTDGSWLGTGFVDQKPQQLRERLDRYAVAWIVAVRPETIAYLDANRDIVRPAEAWAGFRTFQVLNPQPFATGGARVDLGLNRIRVSGAGLPSTLIRLHWHQRLRTVPPLPIARVRFPDDPVGLVSVANGAQREFELRCD